MTGADLTPEQLAWFKAIVGRHLRFYGQLRTRMEKRRFRGDDPLYRGVCQAFNAVHALNVELHYLSCDPGSVGRAKFELKDGEAPAWIRALEE
jgi:hypothetical protein